MRAGGFTGFVHVELAADVRRRIVDVPKLATGVGRCLLGAGP